MQNSMSTGAALAVGFQLIFSGANLAANSCQPIPTFADGKRPLSEVYVSPSGSDDRGAGTEAEPFRSIGRALQRVRPGDSVRLLPGTYSPGVPIANLSGTAAAPIWFGGVPGRARPVIAGGSGGIHLSRVRYVVIENLEVSEASGNGINCDDGGDVADANATRHILFRNLSIHDIGRGGNQDGLKLSGVNDYFVLDCEFARISSGGSGIDHVGCHRGLIARCTFQDTGNSVQCNLWFAFDRADRSRPALPAIETAGIYGVNPSFNDLENGDLTLRSNSPAAAKGMKLPAVRADLLECCYATPPSIGAYEAKAPRRAL